MVASPWADAILIYRRMVMLRLLGRASEAARLEHTAWTPAIAAAHAHGGEDDELAALQHTEDERLATASVVADLVAARLPAAPSQPLVPASSPPPPPARPAGGDINIADMIDSMLAGQRAARTS